MSGTPSSGSRATRLGIGCVFNILLFVAIGAANDRLLTPTIHEPPLRFGFALTSALLLSVGLSSFWSLARGFGSGAASRGAILRRVQSGGGARARCAAHRNPPPTPRPSSPRTAPLLARLFDARA